MGSLYYRIDTKHFWYNVFIWFLWSIQWRPPPKRQRRPPRRSCSLASSNRSPPGGGGAACCCSEQTARPLMHSSLQRCHHPPLLSLHPLCCQTGAQAERGGGMLHTPRYHDLTEQYCYILPPMFYILQPSKTSISNYSNCSASQNVSFQNLSVENKILS